MRLSRRMRKRAGVASGLSIPMLLLAPTVIGQQDLIALVVRQPSVAERLRQHVQHVIASPFGTIHSATFSFPRPVGATVPEVPADYRLASLNVDPRDLEFTGSINSRAEIDLDDRSSPPVLTFPTVNRALKGDFLVPRARLEPQPPSPPDAAPKAKPPRKPAFANERETESSTAALHVDPAPALDTTPLTRTDQLVSGAPSTSSEVGLARPTRSAARHDPARPEAALGRYDRLAPVAEANRRDTLTPEKEDEPSEAPAVVIGVDPSPTVTTANMYFGIERLGSGAEALEPWAPGEEPMLAHANTDPDIKLSALRPGGDPDTSKGGETVASKGEVTGHGRKPITPAERLGLDTKSRTKAAKCLAEAVYFEARGEPERGQKAVAQVVMNRVFSGFYPSTVCGVVYQNAHRHLACQFTFACDNVADRVTEPDMWEQAKHIADDTLDGKIWLPEIGKSTHYHASWVRPSWVNEMKKLHRIGVHTFYRPRAWGNGADEPAWGSGAKQGAESAADASPADQAVEN